MSIELTLKFQNYSGFKKQDLRIYNPDISIKQIKDDMYNVRRLTKVI